MAYRFALERKDYSPFASGQVLHSAPGQTAFPVRLASEIFQRCAAHLTVNGVAPPYLLYDPCCGGAQLLTTLALLHGHALHSLVGSDVDPAALRLAERNLALLTSSGLDARVSQLEALRDAFGKPSHGEAVEHARTLRARLAAALNGRTLATELFKADATRAEALLSHLSPHSVDVAISDVPYGRLAGWRRSVAEVSEGKEAQPAASQLLEALRPLLRPGGIVAVAANKEQRVRHDAYRRVAQLRLGKRHVTFLTPLT